MKAYTVTDYTNAHIVTIKVNGHLVNKIIGHTQMTVKALNRMLAVKQVDAILNHRNYTIDYDNEAKVLC